MVDTADHARADGPSTTQPTIARPVSSPGVLDSPAGPAAYDYADMGGPRPPCASNALLTIGVERRAHGSVIVVAPTGDLDITTVPQLDQTLWQVLSTANFHRLVLDLDQVRFFGAAGLHCVLRTEDRVARAGVEFSVVIGDGAAGRVLDLFRADIAADFAATVALACTFPR